MKIKVSIIIPVYNVEPYIEECLNSIANQTVTEGLECIIVDDCGKDNSAALAKRFVEGYHGNVRFSFIQRAENGGLSAARNTGMKAARGEYLYFLDSDDYLIPSAIEKLVSIADRYGGVDLLPALYTTYEGHYMESFVRHSFPVFSDNPHIIKRALLDYYRIPMTATNRLIRRQLVIDNNLWFREGIIHEDNHWNFFIAKYVKRMAFCCDKLYYYRIIKGSITQSADKEKRIFAYATMVKDFNENIDPFEIGAQKRYIFLHLLGLIWISGTCSWSKYGSIFNGFSSKCKFFERMLFVMTMYSRGPIRKMCGDLLSKVFLKS